MSTPVETGASVLAGISDELANAVEQAGKSIVAVRARRNVAAGGIVWSPGIVVTTDHVIENEDAITVILPGGQEVKATLAGRDPGTDLAVLRVDAGTIPPAEFGDSATLRVGQLALAVARPGGEGTAASIGIVSALSGSFRTWRGGTLDQLIRTDLTLYPGFSGGPLVNVQGKIVGINTSGLSRGLALTIPTSTIKRVTDALLSRGKISRGYLGVGLQPVQLPADLAGKLELNQSSGLMVTNLENEGPAARGGLLLGDILIAFAGKTVDDTHDVQNLLDPESVGKSLQARVIRGGELRTTDITVGER